jgi:hypothetical protein
MQGISNSTVALGYGPGTPSGATNGRFINLRNIDKVRLVVSVSNATTVTGSAVTVKQAKDASGTGVKNVDFYKVYVNSNAGAASAYTETPVTGSTFTTSTTNNAKLIYIIEIDSSELDTNGGYNHLAIGLGTAANTTITVHYIAKTDRLPAWSLEV